MRARIVEELAALREAESDLRRSNAELEQFAYVASHDLQEPLRKVASFCQLLQQRYGGQLDARADQYIGFAVDGARRMQDLINDLLAFSRVGRIENPHTDVDCNALMARVLADLERAIEENGATIEAGPLPTVHGDAGLLRLVFQNLCANAIKFRGRGGARREARRRARGRLLALPGFRQRDRDRPGVRGAHLRALPAPASAHPVRGHRDRARDVPQDRRVPRRPHVAGHRTRRRGRRVYFLLHVARTGPEN